jgi:hypothetical protein
MLSVLIVFTACLAVGLTAPASAPWTITVHTTLWRLERVSDGLARPRALGLDVDVKCGSAHYRIRWPGFLVAALSTTPPARTI